jgi:two-component system CheB/CheR fusion protein
VDRDFVVRTWEERMQELRGLRADEAKGRSIFGLDIGLPVEKLWPAIRACLGGGPETSIVDLDATNRKGRAIRCSVTCTPLRQDGGVSGVILLIHRVEGRARRSGVERKPATKEGAP